MQAIDSTGPTYQARLAAYFAKLTAAAEAVAAGQHDLMAALKCHDAAAIAAAAERLAGRQEDLAGLAAERKRLLTAAGDDGRGDLASLAAAEHGPSVRTATAAVGRVREVGRTLSLALGRFNRHAGDVLAIVGRAGRPAVDYGRRQAPAPASPGLLVDATA